MAVAAFLAGCGGPDCEDVCKDVKCDGVTESECKTKCDSLDNVADKGGCSDQFDKYLECMDEAGSAACGDKPTKCNSEATNLLGCVVKYCTSNPTASECKAVAVTSENQ